MNNIGLVMRKPAFCICENKDADQLRGNREADQCLCFLYTDSKIPLLPKSEISCLYPSCVVVQPGWCGTRSETPKTGFLTTRLIFGSHNGSLTPSTHHACSNKSLPCATRNQCCLKSCGLRVVKIPRFV